MAVYLVTSQEIKDNTPLGGNVDADKYLHFINDIQVMVVENVLGTKLYDKILTDFQADTLAGLYLQMFDNYIKPVIWHSVFAEYVKIGSILVQNGGIYKHVAQNAEVAGIDDIAYVAKNAQSKADTYIARLERFLCDQKSNISEYTLNQDEDYDIDPKSNINTISGWYFGTNQGRSRNYYGGNTGGCDCDDSLLLE